MRRFFTLPYCLLFLVSISLSVTGSARILYTSPTGNDANPGTITSPFLTLNKAWTVVLPGDTVYMRGGTYAYNIQQYLSGKNGASGNMIKVWAYPGENPIITKGNPYTNNYYRGGCYFEGNYVHFRGLRITGFTQQDSYVWNGLLVMNSSNNIFERLEVDNNGAGMYIQGGSTGNLVLNSDFHHNYDPITGGGNADGLDVAYINSGTSNTVRGCRAWSNSDDGFDAFENLGYIWFDQCWSWNNGYIPGTSTPGTGSNGVGYKLGTAGTGNSGTFLRKLTNCLAFVNRLSGFHQEEGDCRMELYNNVSYSNGEHGYLFDWLNRAHIFKNNIAFNNNANNAVISPASSVTNNSYGGLGYASSGWANTTSALDFVSILLTGVDGLRLLDGSLPVLPLFQLVPLSDLVNAGTNVGIPFNGSAPDIGAFEYGVALPNQPPVANAGTDKNITLPTNSITQVGSGTDPDGTISAYLWTKVAGPTQFTIVSPTQATTVINGLGQGVYQFELRVTDNQGATDTDTMVVTVNPAPNQPPVANAGTDKNITLPTNSITQVGSGTDPDGTITAYLWTKVAGPTQFTIVSPTQAQTVINNLGQGVYQFELRVTDNQGATDTDTMVVTVNAAANQPPVSNAGTDKNITLPTNTITQIGSGTDPDGTITAYQWTKVAGPTQFTIVFPTQAQTVINNLAQGVYQFELRVTDNQGATDTDTMIVTVNAAPPNQPPVANAGTDKNITLPTNSITQIGSGTDPDGTITVYQWTKVAGPTQFTILFPTQAQTVINNLAQGVYQFELRVTDNQGATDTDTMIVTVNPPPNQPPVADAGTDKNITLPTSSISQIGSAIDPDGTIVSYQWSRVSGPAQYVIISPSLPQTVINNLVQGVYQFELRVTDNQGAIDTDTMSVIVNAAPTNQPPVANAGTDKNITLPTNNITQIGSGTDPDGSITNYQWTKIAGPSQFTIVFPTQAQTVINNLVQGVYQFELTVTDNQGSTDTDTMIVTVNAAPSNQPPVANAGTDKNITLPTNSISQIGSGTDPDGTITNYQWTKVSGPSQYTIAFPTQAQTTINNLVQGVYQFELAVTDNQGSTDTDTMIVTVNAAPSNQPPVANAGTDKNITLPTNSITQVGSGTDPDGTITAYQWTKIAGPIQYSIVFPTQAQTIINTLVQGVYQFELRVTDNQGATDTDTMIVTVNAAPPPTNQPPVANAGTDKNITLPVNSITQIGSGTDPDGTITAYQWTKVSGPAQFNIVFPTQAQTIIDNLVQGVYQFELRVTDNQGATDTDTMTVTVTSAPSNQPPVANAGTDKNITLPTNSITQMGSGTDPDGTITNYQWTKIAGPSQFTIVFPNQPQTIIEDLVQGVYQFELSVTDNQGSTDTDTMTVTVSAAPSNQPPVADAGTDKNITLPTNSITQIGSGTDPDGTITNYQWTKVSGPSQFTIVFPTQAQTIINNLAQGVYQFELRVTDNQGSTDTDTMTVTVNAAPSNQPPVANAGTDKNITLPTNSITQIGSGTDPDGTITAYQWTKVAGPTQFTIVFPTQAQTIINNLAQGVYQFELRVTDNQSATDTDTMTVIVNAAPPPTNQPPVANAGTDKNITLPANSITQLGSATDPDGVVIAYQWTKVAGPNQFTIVFPNQAQTIINNLAQGTYLFELMVTDNLGTTDTDTMTVIVNASPTLPNQPPAANAGPDQNITLPVDQVNVSGSGTDADGTIVSYVWTMISGPSQYTITSPAQAQTDFTNLIEGTYQCELTVTDNLGAIGRDTVVITVSPDPTRRSFAILYPNPATTTVNVRVDAITTTNNTRIQVYNIMGIMMYDKEIMRNQQIMTIQFDVNHYPKGSYFVKISVDINNTITLPFVKQ